MGNIWGLRCILLDEKEAIMPVLYEIPWKVMDELLRQQQQDSSDCDEDHACPICGEFGCDEHKDRDPFVDCRL